MFVVAMLVTQTLSCLNEPAIYRAVIDDVIASIKSEFDEYGVGEEVLAELQNVSIQCIVSFS